ncbi:hypothetical protein [uncultured Enterococcus sp.]|uniref:hypothetical protein n=1 Tax=uncultured Enterococcus sp. TaxID=167972 RepID=UPI002AA7BEB1|nr:hypothetical protein [uncultured Enterococcus sp.]
MMDMYDYEDYCEPTEAELIVQEAEQKLKELLNPEVKNELAEKDNLIATLKNKVSILQSEKYNLQHELGAAKREAQKEIEVVKENIVKSIGETLSKEYWVVECEYGHFKDSKEIETKVEGLTIIENTSRNLYSVKEFPKMYIEKIGVENGKTLIFYWNDDEDSWMAKTVKFHSEFKAEGISGRHWLHAFDQKEEAQKYADYLNNLEESSVNHRLEKVGKK